MGGVFGVELVDVVVIGVGIVGYNVVCIVNGMGVIVMVLDINIDKFW